MTTSNSRRLRSVQHGVASSARSYLLAAGLGLAGLGAIGVVVLASAPVPVSSAAPEQLPRIEPVATDGTTEDDSPVADEMAALPTVSYELFLARDPFEPVLPEPEPVDPPAPDDPSDPSDPDDPDQPAAPGNGVSNGPCTGDIEVVCDGRVLSVVEVSEENGELVAVIQVDAMRYEVRVGDTFADRFEVISISPEEVRVLYGDSVVRIQVGDNALK